VGNTAHRDVFLFGLYTGMRLGEVVPLRWEDAHLDDGLFRVEETKTGVPLELPVTRQLGEILAWRRAEGNAVGEELRVWVFPSRMSASGHVEELNRHYEAIGRAGGAKFWFQCARLTGASAAGESPAGRRRQATTSTPSHGLTSARTEVKR